LSLAVHSNAFIALESHPSRYVLKAAKVRDQLALADGHFSPEIDIRVVVGEFQSLRLCNHIKMTQER
jgi:hypothetical protein